MFVKYFVVSNNYFDTMDSSNTSSLVGSYISLPFPSADAAREESLQLAAKHRNARFYICEAFEQVESTPVMYYTSEVEVTKLEPF